MRECRGCQHPPGSEVPIPGQEGRHPSPASGSRAMMRSWHGSIPAALVPLTSMIADDAETRSPRRPHGPRGLRALPRGCSAARDRERTVRGLRRRHRRRPRHPTGPGGPRYTRRANFLAAGSQCRHRSRARDVLALGARRRPDRLSAAAQLGRMDVHRGGVPFPLTVLMSALVINGARTDPGSVPLLSLWAILGEIAFYPVGPASPVVLALPRRARAEQELAMGGARADRRHGARAAQLRPPPRPVQRPG